MPTYNRRTLRQHLSQEWLHDIVIGTTSGSWGTQAGSYNIIDSSQADPTASGEQLYQRHWLRLLGSAGLIQDLRIGSYNTGSGAYLGAQTLATTVFSGMPFEVHAKLSPADKDIAITRTIEGIGALQQEIPIWAIANGHDYSLGPEILDVIDAYYLSDPTDSLNIGRHQLQHFTLRKTATGQCLSIIPSLIASYQLVLSAITTISLGAGDLATVNLPSESLVLAGAAARCYWMLEQNAGQNTKQYQERRLSAARQYNALAARFQPIATTRKIQLEEWW